MTWTAALVILFAVLTLGALFLGLGGFARGGEFNRKYGNVVMRWRIGLQLAAVLLLMLLFAVAGRE